jgi:diguanylate cyclase (GGDEF)-like protein
VNRPAPGQAALLAACVLIIGALDHATGPDIGFSLFYLAPIAWGAWRLDARSAGSLAVLASLSWLASDIAWRGVGAVPIWNGLTRLGIYGGTAWLIARVRADQRQLRALNDRLQALLAEEQQLARTDALTGLPNRRLLVDELRRAIKRSRRLRSPLAVAFLDLEHLERLNERLGHAAGDEVLRRVAEVLARQVRGSDVAARFGGDEFAVLLDRCSEGSARIAAERLLEQVQNSLAETSGGAVAVSIGVACFDTPPDAPEVVLDHADAAMYCAKSRGTNQIYVVHYPAAA